MRFGSKTTVGVIYNFRIYEGGATGLGLQQPNT